MTAPDTLREALEQAEQSLRTIAENAGKRTDSDGNENYLQDFLQVRGYANSRASAARAALASPQAQPPAAVSPTLAADIKALKAADEVKSKLAGPPLGFYLLGFADCRDAAAALAARPQAQPATPDAKE